MRKIAQSLLLATLLGSPAILVTPVWGQYNTRTERVQFESGTFSKVITGSIRVDEEVVYLVNAREGQYMSIILRSGYVGTNFEIAIAGKTPRPIFNSFKMGGDVFRLFLPESGDYIIRVFLMPFVNTNFEHLRSDYSLEITITDDD